MREFAKSEIIRQKCSICGSKNKLYTEFTYQGLHYGYDLTCCNCGHTDTFIDSENGVGGLIRGWMKEGKRACIQLTTCTKVKCPFYKNSKLWDDDTILDEDGNNGNKTDNMCGNPGGSGKSNITVEVSTCPTFCSCNKNSKQNKLEDNACKGNCSKFR